MPRRSSVEDNLEDIAESLAQLVDIEKQRLEAELKHMTIDDSLLQQVVDAINSALLAESNDVTAMAAKDATIASLQTQLAPNPALLASVQTALSNALAANPPVAVPPVPAPVSAQTVAPVPGPGPHAV